MSSRKFSKSVTVSLVALAAATGAAVLEAGATALRPGTAAADVATTPAAPTPPPIPYPNVSIKMDLKIPTITIPAIKLPGNKAPAPEGPSTDRV
jgi:hypothetical protein